MITPILPRIYQPFQYYLLSCLFHFHFSHPSTPSAFYFPTLFLNRSLWIFFLGHLLPPSPLLFRRDFLHEFLGVPVLFFPPYFMILFFFLVMSQQQPTQVYPVSQQYRRCNSPSTFSLFPILLYVFSPVFSPIPATHTHDFGVPPPSSFFSSPLGWRNCPFWEEIGSVLANYLLACHLASPFVFSPVLLKGWLDWMVSLFLLSSGGFWLRAF